MSAAALLPSVCLVLLVLCFGQAALLSGRGHRWREALLAGAVVWGVLVAAFTEGLSLFGLLTWPWLVALWGLTTAAALSVLLLAWAGASVGGGLDLTPGPFPKEKESRRSDRQPLPRREAAAVRLSLSTWWRGGRGVRPGRLPERMVVLAMCGLGAIVVIAGLTAIVAPPNTYDSMTYHLPRVMHWIQNQSVAHYPTHIPRQLHFPPGAEFILIHIHILAGNDRLLNLVQWLGMVGSMVGVSLLAQRLGAAGAGQVLASVIAATLPMGMLQASSTQNDYVVTFWLVCLAYFILAAIRSPGWGVSAAVGASLGLALLTKATAYLFAAPLVVWLLVGYGRSLRWRCYRHVLLIAVVALALNLGHWLRNTNLYGAPLARQDGTSTSSYTNEVIGVAALFSNVIRNASLHASVPVGSEQVRAQIGQQLAQWIERAHALIGIDASDPRTTWQQVTTSESQQFRLEPFHVHEDIASNPLHLLLILYALVAICSRGALRRAPLLLYAGVLVAGFLLFCLVLKWQPWHSRLHLPLFVLWAPAVSIALSRGWPRRIGHGAAAVLLVAALVLIGYNETRPLYGPRSIFPTERADQYFATRPFGADYRAAIRYLNTQPYRHIGLILGANAWEYPFWALVEGEAGDSPRLEHVLVSNVSGRLATQRQQPAAIICVSCTEAQVERVTAGYRALHRFGIVTVLDRSAVVGGRLDRASPPAPSPPVASGQWPVEREGGIPAFAGMTEPGRADQDQGVTRLATA